MVTKISVHLSDVSMLKKSFATRLRQVYDTNTYNLLVIVVYELVYDFCMTREACRIKFKSHTRKLLSS